MLNKEKVRKKKKERKKQPTRSLMKLEIQVKISSPYSCSLNLNTFYAQDISVSLIRISLEK